MESMTKKMKPSKGINNGFEDRLSGLPDHLIVHILSFLTTLDAVKTMLLRRFGNLWTLVPALKFDLVEYYIVVCPEMDKLTIFEVFSSFSRFVKTVLMLHKSPTIDRFHLFIGSLEPNLKDRKVIEDIQIWLRFAIDKQVKDLYFFFDCSDDLVLPRCIATSQSLTKLELFGCVIEDHPRVGVHMGNLRKLILSNVGGSNEVFNQLIAGCPSLQELIIDIIDELDNLNVTSPIINKLSLAIRHPKYESFTLSCPNVKILDINVAARDESLMVNMIDVSSLQVVNVTSLPTGCSWSPIKAFLTQFRNVEVLTLSLSALKNFCRRNNINVPITRWKRIILWSYWEDEKCLQLVLELVKSSAQLEELIIYHNYANAFVSEFCITRAPNFDTLNMASVIKYLSENFGHFVSMSWQDHSVKCNPRLSTTYAMPLLKNVTIHGCGSDQLQLIELLLQNAVFLEKLVIHLDNILLTAVDELNLIRQVSNFTRASAKASVIFV